MSLSTVADLLALFGPVPVHRIRMNPPPGAATEEDEEDVVEIANREGRLCELVQGVLLEKAMGYYESYLAGLLIELLNGTPSASIRQRRSVSPARWRAKKNPKSPLAVECERRYTIQQFTTAACPTPGVAGQARGPVLLEESVKPWSSPQNRITACPRRK